MPQLVPFYDINPVICAIILLVVTIVIKFFTLPRFVRLFISPPKPHAFVTLPLNSFALSFVLRMNNNDSGEDESSSSESEDDGSAQFTPQDFINKEDAGDLLNKIQKKGVELTREDYTKLNNLKRRCPDYFNDRGDTTTEEILVEMEEKLGRDQKKLKRRWLSKHPAIPKFDWNSTTIAKDNNNSSQSTSTTSNSDHSSATTSAVNSVTTSSAVNSAATTSSQSIESTQKKESTIDFVVDKMESEMPNYTEPEDV